MKMRKEKDLTPASKLLVKSKKRIDNPKRLSNILKRIFALKFKNIIPPSGASVKVLYEFYEENYEVFVAMEKWKRRLCVILLGVCVTTLILCGYVILDLFMRG